MIKNQALYDYLALRAEAQGFTLTRLWEFLGKSKGVFYKKFARYPWNAFGGHDLKFAQRIVERLPDNLKKVLWLMGYNPFLDEGLTLDELTSLWEFTTRLVLHLKSGELANVEKLGDLSYLIGISFLPLRRQAYGRLLARGGELRNKEPATLSGLETCGADAVKKPHSE